MIATDSTSRPSAPSSQGNAWVSAEDAPLREGARRLRFRQASGILVVDALYDRNCQWCSGRGKVTRNGAEKPCDCALARGQVFFRSLSVMSPTTTELPKALPEPRTNQRREQLARLDAEIASLEKRGAEAVARHDVLVQEKRSALDDLQTKQVRITSEIDRHRVDGRQKRETAADLRRQAAEMDRLADAALTTASRIERDEMPPLTQSIVSATNAAQKVEAEHDRVIRHFDRMKRPLANRRAALAARLG